MKTTQDPNHAPSKRKSIPLLVGFVAALIVWDVVPGAISLLAPRHGWADSRPGPWNLLGLIPVIVGNIGLFGGIVAHAAQTSMKIDFELDKPYLFTDGLYRYSRNPMYVFELILMSGWIICYGSISVLIGSLVWWAFFNFYIIPQEERVMESRFGEAYRNYKDKVPRWFGKIRKII